MHQGDCEYRKNFTDNFLRPDENTTGQLLSNIKINENGKEK